MTELAKASATLGNSPLSAQSGISWRLQTGVAPFQTVLSVHLSEWDKLQGQIGKPLELKITDARGVVTTIKEVYILHTVPSGGPRTQSFLVSDKRWKWPYQTIARDYNIPRRTGNRTAFGTVPTQTIVDTYLYRRSSLGASGARWTARECVEDVLGVLEGVGGYVVDSWPLADTAESAGQFTIQNVMIRDRGDVALGRVLGYVPGAEVYIGTDGKVHVIDRIDLNAVDEFAKKLPPLTWDGDRIEKIDRTAIRPSKIHVYYQREVEVLFQFDDDYEATTAANPSRLMPYLENVIPTVDTTTRISEFDPEANAVRTKNVPPGTWVPVQQWLQAMDAVRPGSDDEHPGDSLPWTFDTLKRHWMNANLEALLGANRNDNDPTGVVALRVQALKQHFRQTFRINRRFMDRIRDMQPVRAFMLDPVTGARAPAGVWGQACVIPSDKGNRMASRSNPAQASLYRNVDYITTAQQQGTSVIYSPTAPAVVNVLDRDVGVFRIEWVMSPYGTEAALIPSLLTDEEGANAVASHDLSMQDWLPMGCGCKVAYGTNGIFLKGASKMRALMTVVPCAPNNMQQFHRIEVPMVDVRSTFRTEATVPDGKGPELHVFVPPGELTARFAWENDNEATVALVNLLGLNTDDPSQAGYGTPEIPGFVLTNDDSELIPHAKSVAAEAMAQFIDSYQGRSVTKMPDREGLKLVGNMGSASISVATAPSAKVVAVHDFSGTMRPVDRMALLPETARHAILGTLTTGTKAT